MEDVIKMMRENIKVDLEIPRPRWGQLPEPSAFHVRFTYPDPNIAAKVTQRFGTLFVEQNARDRGVLAGATDEFLEKQLVESRIKLEGQERRLETFRQQHGKELPTQMSSNMQALSNAQMQAQSLVESIARDRDRKQMLERLYREAAAEPAPVATVAQNPATPGAPGGGSKSADPDAPLQAGSPRCDSRPAAGRRAHAQSRRGEADRGPTGCRYDRIGAAHRPRSSEARGSAADAGRGREPGSADRVQGERGAAGSR
jgi:hypothetical protein